MLQFEENLPLTSVNKTFNPSQKIHDQSEKSRVLKTLIISRLSDYFPFDEPRVVESV